MFFTFSKIFQKLKITQKFGNFLVPKMFLYDLEIFLRLHRNFQANWLDVTRVTSIFIQKKFDFIFISYTYWT